MAVSQAFPADGMLTWNNAPPPATTVTASPAGFAASTWLSLDVTPLVRGNGTYSFALTTASSGFAAARQ